MILNLFDLTVNELYEWILLYSNTHEKKNKPLKEKRKKNANKRRHSLDP